ncbi:hypothetical protein M422DRAFT_35787 [Sphaerobolus stellatus SS14]|uniref:Uncharacterized protein n=1 Tax=Sphaerobolus stellatus (strain SS14) TaxID=990650 RepID=A0A0C9TQR8_SPHS4|nr:hypothetical protein M422DRAFT_35787 [Sphaerobolus stellatus SS14]
MMARCQALRFRFYFSFAARIRRTARKEILRRPRKETLHIMIRVHPLLLPLAQLLHNRPIPLLALRLPHRLIRRRHLRLHSKQWNRLLLTLPLHLWSARDAGFTDVPRELLGCG